MAKAECSPQAGPVDSRCIGPERHPHSQTFRNIVQGDGKDQQGGALPVRFGPFALFFFEIDVQVRHEFVQTVEEQCAQCKTNGGREP